MFDSNLFKLLLIGTGGSSLLKNSFNRAAARGESPNLILQNKVFSLISERYVYFF
jgi:hypothetical protein